MTMWLNQYLRQDSEKEKALQQQQQQEQQQQQQTATAMEAGVHYNRLVAAQQYHQANGGMASTRLQSPACKLHLASPRITGQVYHDSGTSPIHEMTPPPHMARLGMAMSCTVRQNSILSVVSDLDSNLPGSPTSIVSRDRMKSADSEYTIDNDLNDGKHHSDSSLSLSSPHRTIGKKCFIFSMTLMTVVCIALIFAFFTWYQSKTVALLSNQHSCVVCDHLVISTDPIDDHRQLFEQRWQNGVQLCCAQNATQFEALLSVIVERKIRMGGSRSPYAAAQSGTELQVMSSGERSSEKRTHVLPDAPNIHAAHVFLSSPPQEPGLQVIRGWSNRFDASFVRKGLTFDVRRGRFIISKSGTYVVYSHLLFLGPGPEEAEAHPDRHLRLFQQKVYRQNLGFSSGSDQILLEDEQALSCELDLQQTACFTSSIVGQVHLHANDEVYIRVRNGHLLKPGKGTFFGLYLVE